MSCGRPVHVIKMCNMILTDLSERTAYHARCSNGTRQRDPNWNRYPGCTHRSPQVPDPKVKQRSKCGRNSSGRKLGNRMKMATDVTIPKAVENSGTKRKRLCSERASQTVNAASAGDLALLKKFKNQRYDLTDHDYDERTPLHLAAAENHYEVVVYLVEVCKVPVDAQDRWGKTALDGARDGGHKVIEEYLERHLVRRQQEVHEERSDPSTSAEQQGSQLCNAAAEGDIERINKLVKRGIDPNQADYDGRTALHLACAEDQLPTVQYLLEICHVWDRPTDRFNNTPLADAEQVNNVEICNFLKNHRQECENAKRKLCLSYELMRVVESGEEANTEKLLKEAKHFGDLLDVCFASKTHRKTWVCAIHEKEPEYNKFMTISDEESNVLVKAIETEQLGIIATMIELGLLAEKSFSNYALNVCMKENKYAIMELLLQTGACPNYTDNRLMTPLNTAIELKDELALEKLLKYGADPNIKDIHTNTPLMHAIQGWSGEKQEEESQFSIMKQLLERGADVNARDGQSCSALHYASGPQMTGRHSSVKDKDRANIVRFLIQHNACTDLQDACGNTPLHVASSSNNGLVVEILLSGGASTHIANARNYTPQELSPVNSKSWEVLRRASADGLREQKHRHSMRTNPVKACQDSCRSTTEGFTKKTPNRRKREASEHSEPPKIERFGDAEHMETGDCLKSLSTVLATAGATNGSAQLERPTPSCSMPLYEVCKVISKFSGKKWKELLRDLNKDLEWKIEPIIDELDAMSVDLHERALQGLRRWLERRGKKATFPALVTSLHHCKMQRVIEELEKWSSQNATGGAKSSLFIY